MFGTNLTLKPDPSFTANHPFEIWEGQPEVESYAGNRFSNLQTAALTVVIRSEINRLWARQYRQAYIAVQVRYHGTVYKLEHCREFLRSGFQIGGVDLSQPMGDYPVRRAVPNAQIN